MSADPQRVEAILAEAAAIADPAARAACLNQACGGDADLRREVESLLAAHEEAGAFLDEPADGAPFVVPPLGGPGGEPAKAGTPNSEQPGDCIGRYKLLEKIGEGGFGDVWMAEQEEPVRRRVALKIIKLGMDTREVIARFEAERQALALMDHPNIARIFDGGVTEGRLTSCPERGTSRPEEGDKKVASPLPAGRPYFVMELVRGIRITDYCDQHQLSVRQRLELFMQVCHAVQHAHQKGIIHRDLKPSNILVTVNDGVALPKVIDFGIAKAVEQRLTDKTVFTRFAQFLGTPAYMSPEQAELTSQDIDTRSDIYSLGVLLYELLTGTTPFDTQELLQAGFDEMRRVIRETEPEKPSTRLTQTLVAADVRRLKTSSSQPSTLNSQPDSDKASSRRLLQINKERIQQLRGDLDWMVMKCLEKDRTRRYETANALAADLDRYLHDEPVLARPPGKLYRWQKFVHKHRAAVVVAAGFLLLLATATVISTALALWANQERERAARSQKDALSNERQAREAEAEAKEILRFFEANVLAAMRPEGQHGGLGREVTVRAALDAAEPQISQAFTNRPLAEASIRETLGMTYHHLGAAAQAARQHEQALRLRQARLGQDDPLTLDSMNRVAMAHIALGQLADAERLLEQALTLAQAKTSPGSPEVFSYMDNLATVYSKTGRHSNAVAMLETALEGVKAQRGLDDHSTLRMMNNLANAYRQAGQRGKALSLLEETLQRARDKLGDDHPDTLSVMNNLSVAYRGVGRFDDAVSLSATAVRLGEEKLGRNHPNALTWQRNLALTYRDLHLTNDALRLFSEIIDLQKGRSDPDTSDLFRSQKELAQYCIEVNRLGDAQSLWRGLLNEQRKKLAPDDIALAETMSGLGYCLLRQGNHEQAEPLLLQAWEALKKPEGERPSPSRAKLLKGTVEHIVQLYEAWNKPDEAAKWRAKLP